MAPHCPHNAGQMIRTRRHMPRIRVTNHLLEDFGGPRQPGQIRSQASTWLVLCTSHSELRPVRVIGYGFLRLHVSLPIGNIPGVREREAGAYGNETAVTDGRQLLSDRDHDHEGVGDWTGLDYVMGRRKHVQNPNRGQSARDRRPMMETRNFRTFRAKMLLLAMALALLRQQSRTEAGSVSGQSRAEQSRGGEGRAGPGLWQSGSETAEPTDAVRGVDSVRA
ncbi:hypothetical protein MPTK1_6g05820 [Marchantia polymorpha subsp. ruderalis]|uniref:Uncharacterized protein n=2 Tax=Marchantia polymorpha TaxID=3197 RepID=A0AAF6BNZ1_MARPO|nr:hypothetical protein MARPO_0097s0061 [Marchantia polymorpha]BBN13725.1 hypothetical protein Mp_6g05820 [Marchantia polymorpha subsp. ruderalis]|eukprot:PTQ32586.1 hypothetical protein MARPO_0097s0061 [Marchantia polymorpha]